MRGGASENRTQFLPRLGPVWYTSHTASKVSKYGVFSGPYFPVFGLEKTPYLDTFHTEPVVLVPIVDFF